MTEPIFAKSMQDSPISKELFHSIRFLAPKGSTILELGSGQGSTPALAGYYDVHSVEHKPDFIGMYNKPENYIYIPLTDPHNFYNREQLQEKLNFKYSLLLVDGPDTENRQFAFSECLDLFDKTVPWVFDDYGYKLAWSQTMHTIAGMTEKEIFVFEYVGKPFCVMI